MQSPAFKFHHRLVAGGFALTIFIVAGILLARSLQGRSQTTGSKSSLDQLEAACIHDMVARTCKVMNAADRPPNASPGDIVFIAGIGAIDSVSYQQMYAAGEGMCTAVRQACERDWNSRQCQAAKALYPTL